MIGQTVSHYRILEKLGGGGMGVVYKAEDTKLGRFVALKFLPHTVGEGSALPREPGGLPYQTDPQALERFKREARAASALNHPHICTLYDFGQQEGVDFLVMEYLEGETLAGRLEKGPLPLDQVLKYGAEIADALSRAHRQGVIHRDLKPGNIMLTKSGVKLLDFGLAKALPRATPVTQGLAAMVTDDSPLTAEGTLVGTLQYMAPEHLEGKEADARTDIFALGAVLYEMATGKKAFEGKSQASVIAAILEKDPTPITTLQPLAPPALERLVKMSLSKDPDNRWQTAHDVEMELKWIFEGGSQVTLPPTAPGKGIRALGRRALILSLGTLLLGAAIAGLAVWSLKPTPPRPVTRTVITLPPGERLAGLEQPAVALSPDGSHLVYVAVQGVTQQLYLRAMDSLEARPIPGTEGASNPFFSPDGQWVGFFTENNLLKKVSLAGGAPVTLAAATPVTQGASWGPDDTIIFTLSPNSGLSRVSAAGGTPHTLTNPEPSKGENSHRWPQILPGGKAVLFTLDTGGSFDDARIAVLLLKTGERRILFDGATNARYVPTGHLVFARGETLLAVPFNLAQLKVTGPAVPIVEGVMTAPGTGAAHFAVSSAGSLAYVQGRAQAPERTLVWVDRKGAARPLTTERRDFFHPSLSPDGQRVAVGIYEWSNSEIWVLGMQRGTLTRLTFDPGEDFSPIWTPDGKRLALSSEMRSGAPRLFWMPADGSGGPEELLSDEPQIAPYALIPNSWSPDGQTLAFVSGDPSTKNDIRLLSLKGDRKSQKFLQTPFIEEGARFSPDGRWLAYQSDESGRNQVYVQPFPGPGGKVQISTEGGAWPVWARNGRELFYRNSEKMMGVAVRTEPTFSGGKPQMLFDVRYEHAWHHPNYDVAPDGQRLLMLKASEQEAAPAKINVVLNWFEELKRQAPTGK